MYATCYVIWTDNSRNHFTFSYEEDELVGLSSQDEFIFRKCLELFPKRTSQQIKWIIKE